MDYSNFSVNFLSEHFADHNENLNEVITSLKSIRSSYVGHVTRLINKINESIKNSENCLIVKCMKDQLALIFEKLEITVNKFISIVEDPNEIQQTNEVCF